MQIHEHDKSEPAFPVNGPNGDHPGMTLRDWFAGQALSGFAANGKIKVEMNEDGPFGSMANWMYRLADAMLAARNHPPTTPAG